jgi:hypothetical protein
MIKQVHGQQQVLSRELQDTHGVLTAQELQSSRQQDFLLLEHTLVTSQFI